MLQNGGQRSCKEELYLYGISPGVLPVISLQNLPTGLLSGDGFQISKLLNLLKC